MNFIRHKLQVVANSGGLSKEEKEAIKETFETFDKDSDGYLSPQELKRCLEELGQHPTEEEILKMINEVDQANKGCLDYNDFEKALLMHRNSKKGNAEDDTVDAFIAMGGASDGKGYVSADKLIKVIKNEFNMTIDIERLLREIDDDNSKRIEYEEFKNLFN